MSDDAVIGHRAAMAPRVVLLPGDGVGREVTEAGRRVLAAAAQESGRALSFSEQRIGGAALDAGGPPLPPETLEACRSADAILLGAVGGPAWDARPVATRPEQGLLQLRRALGVFAHVRPVRVRPALFARSPVKAERLAGVDLVIVREAAGGLYAGAQRLGRDGDDEIAVDECTYRGREIERIVRLAATMARTRRGVLTSIDKANVLETSRLWRRTATRVVAGEFPDLELRHLLVDTAAMELVDRPVTFDVVVTENMFGDILSDLTAVLSGGIGLLPSACFASDGPGLYEPVHGSAPTIAGRGIVNPIGAILSAALLCRHSLQWEREACAIEDAVDETLRAGIMTPDVAVDAPATTEDVVADVLERLRANLRATGVVPWQFAKS
jgi:3-isopropylmalate dehydrogenase